MPSPRPTAEPLGTPPSQTSASELITLIRRVEQQVAALRTIAQDRPVEGLPMLGGALARLGILQAERGRLREAVAAVHEAIEVFRTLASSDSRKTLDLVAALVDLASVHLAFEQPTEGARAAIEAANSLRPVLHDVEPDILPRLASTLSKLDAMTGERVPELAVDSATVYRRLYGELGQQQYAKLFLDTLRRASKQLSRFGKVDQSHQLKLEAESIEDQISAQNDQGQLSRTGQRNSGRGDGNPPPAPPPPTTTSRNDDMEDRLRRLEQLSDKVFDRLGSIEKDLATVRTRSESLASERDVATLIAKSDTYAKESTLRDVADLIRRDMKHDFWILLSAIAGAAFTVVTALYLKKP